MIATKSTQKTHHRDVSHILPGLYFLSEARAVNDVCCACTRVQMDRMTLFQFGFTCSTTASSSVNHEESEPSYLPQQNESGLNIEEYRNVSTVVSTLSNPHTTTGKSKRRGKYTVYTDEDRARIGRYASLNGNEQAKKKVLSDYPKLTESTIRNFKKMYLKKMREEKMKSPLAPQPVTKLPVQPRGRPPPPILLDLDGKLIQFLHALRAKGGVVNIHVVRATAEALICSNPSLKEHFHKFDMPCSWVQSIYRRMGVARRLGTTGRPPVPRGIYMECRLEFLGDIDNKMQIIYAGKTKATQPHSFSFSKEFCISQNAKHWSNEQETLKLIDTIIKPYIAKERKILVYHLSSRRPSSYGMFSKVK